MHSEILSIVLIQQTHIRMACDCTWLLPSF